MENIAEEMTIQQQKSEMEAWLHVPADLRHQPVPTKFIERARELFVRAPENPLLTPQDMPFPCRSVCNPGACLVDDEVLLLLRVINDQDHSSLYVARSADGIGGWRIEEMPLLSPENDAAWYDDWGCEDPRITYLQDRNEYLISYVGWSRYGAGVCLATTQDFHTVTRIGLAIHPYNKDAVLLSRPVAGHYYLLHRPTAGPLENIWVSESDDLIHWGNPRCVLEENDQPGWDSGKVGAGPPPLEIPEGWLLIFHGVEPTASGGWEYRVGLAMLDKDDPGTIIGRWPDWVFGPQEPYEVNPDKGGIVFPTGLIVKDDTLLLYYGAADRSVCVATANWGALRSFRDDVARAVKEQANSVRPEAQR